MALRRLTCAPVIAVALALGVAGCGEEEEAKREGLAVDVGGLDYNVYITRQLNPRDVEDRDYYRGPEPPPNSALYGVFLQVCNNDEEGDAKPAAADFKVVDTQGHEFHPVKVSRENVFAYLPRELSAGDCIPAEGSAAATGPTAGALLIFQLPNTSAENRPLELEIEGPPGAAEGERHQTIELDI